MFGTSRQTPSGRLRITSELIESWILPEESWDMVTNWTDDYSSGHAFWYQRNQHGNGARMHGNAAWSLVEDWVEDHESGGGFWH